MKVMEASTMGTSLHLNNSGTNDDYGEMSAGKLPLKLSDLTETINPTFTIV